VSRDRFTLRSGRRSDIVTGRVTSSYLGYPLLISETEVTVYTPAHRRLGRVASVKQARLLVRGYRRVLREETGSRVLVAP